MTPRDLLTWKTWFYDLALPRLAGRDPAQIDRALAHLGRAVDLLYWPRRFALDQAVDRAARCLGIADPAWRRGFRRDLVDNAPRFLARDLALDGLNNADALARVDFEGWHHLDEARRGGRGVLLVGAHLGAYLTALHALNRRGLPLRYQLQRPQHASVYFRDRLDDRAPPHPQADLLLKRNMAPADAANALLRARAALRSGLILATFGDVAWPHGRSVDWLRHRYKIQSTWLDLAIASAAPVVPIFATHEPGGRFRVAFDPPQTVDPRRPEATLASFLARVEQLVHSHPHEAVAYWTWPAYQPLGPAASTSAA